MTSNPEETTIAPADACPTGITFGESTKLTPDGEVVKNAQIAHFNNGDYVALWTEINVPSPRLEFQLFKNGNTKIITSCSLSDSSPLVQCPGEIVTDITYKKLGRTHIGVYEDYTFLIAWSEQEHTYSPWKIVIKSFKYNIEAGTYTLGEEVKTFEKIQNHGIFGFATLSLDNGFILTYMDDPYKLRTYIYKAKPLGSDDNDSGDTEEGGTTTAPVRSRPPVIIEIDENVKSSYKKEIIVKSVPTQYWFTVISSDLIDNTGITIWNYRIDNGQEVCLAEIANQDQRTTTASLRNVFQETDAKSCSYNIVSNPRELFADFSYGGYIVVAWRDAVKDLTKQHYPVYKAQMYSDKYPLSEAFEISDKDNSNNNKDTYLIRVNSHDQNNIIAAFIAKDATTIQHRTTLIVKMYNKSTNLVDSKSQLLLSNNNGQNRVFEVDGWFTSCTSSKYDIKEPEDTTTEVTIPIIKCNSYKEFTSVCGGTLNNKEDLSYTINVFLELITNYTFVGTFTSETAALFRITFAKTSPYYRTYLSDVSNVLNGYIKVSSDATKIDQILYKKLEYDFQCSNNKESVIDFRFMKGIYLCPGFISMQLDNKIRALSNLLFIYGVKIDNEYKITKDLDEDRCKRKAKENNIIYSGCISYFLLEVYHQWDTCVTSHNVVICVHKHEDRERINEALIKVASIYAVDISDWNTVKNAFNEFIPGGEESYLKWKVLYSKSHSLLTSEQVDINYKIHITVDSGTVICDPRQDFIINAVTIIQSTIYICKTAVTQPHLFFFLLHELQHVGGAIDANIYGSQKCKEWAQGKDVPNAFVADCSAYFLNELYHNMIPRNREMVSQSSDLVYNHKYENNIHISLKIEVKDLVYIATVSLSNNASRKYYIDANSMLLQAADGHSWTFSGDGEIHCSMMPYRSRNLLEIEVGSVIQEEIVLSDYCFFDHVKPGVYQMHTLSKHDLYDGIDVVTPDAYCILSTTSDFEVA